MRQPNLRRFVSLRSVLFTVAALSLLAPKFIPKNHDQPAVPQAPRPAGFATTAALPDPRLTPGASDPAVTQKNISSTICVVGYTRRVRPPSEVSDKLKRDVMSLYHSPGSIDQYEIAQLIPLH